MVTHGSITVDEAKEVHRSLKLAAGMFLHIKEQLLPKLPATPEKGTDFDTRVVEAYAGQSQAEAQEGLSLLMMSCAGLHTVYGCSYSGEGPGAGPQAYSSVSSVCRDWPAVYCGRRCSQDIGACPVCQVDKLPCSKGSILRVLRESDHPLLVC